MRCDLVVNCVRIKERREVKKSEEKRKRSEEKREDGVRNPSPLLLHDLVHLPRIKFDVQVSKRGLKLFKVLHLRGNIIPNFEFKSLEIKKDCNLLCGEFCEIILLVELVKKFTEQKSACKIFLEVRDFL